MTEQVIFDIMNFGATRIKGDCDYSHALNKRKKEDLLQDLNSSIAILQTGVTRALEFFQSPAALDIDPVSAMQERNCDAEDEEDLSRAPVSIAEMFHVFDGLAYLVVGMSNLDMPGITDSEEWKQSRKVVSALFELVCDVDLYWRLIPLNNERLRILKYIPEDVRYLFPWYYASSSDYPSSAVSSIIRYMARRDKPNEEWAMSGLFDGLIADMQADTVGWQHIMKKAQSFKSVTMGESA